MYRVGDSVDVDILALLLTVVDNLGKNKTILLQNWRLIIFINTLYCILIPIIEQLYLNIICILIFKKNHMLELIYLLFTKCTLI